MVPRHRAGCSDGRTTPLCRLGRMHLERSSSGYHATREPLPMSTRSPVVLSCSLEREVVLVGCQHEVPTAVRRNRQLPVGVRGDHP